MVRVDVGVHDDGPVKSDGWDVDLGLSEQCFEVLHVLACGDFDFGAACEVRLILRIILHQLLNSLIHCQVLPAQALHIHLFLLRLALKEHIQVILRFLIVRGISWERTPIVTLALSVAVILGFIRLSQLCILRSFFVLSFLLFFGIFCFVFPLPIILDG